MTGAEFGALLPWITGSGGAIVVLFLWNRDLTRQRDYERARNAELTDRYAKSTTDGNDAIRDLTDATLDAMDLIAAREAGAPLPRRRRPGNAR